MVADKPVPRNQHSSQAWRRERIAELRRQDWTYPAIAAELGTTVKAVTGVLNRLRKAGTDLPPPRKRGSTKPRSTTRHQRILELRRQGWTYAAIAQDVGMTPGSVSVALSRLRKNGTPVPPGRKGPRPKPQTDKPQDHPQPDEHTQPRQ